MRFIDLMMKINLCMLQNYFFFTNIKQHRIYNFTIFNNKIIHLTKII